MAIAAVELVTATTEEYKIGEMPMTMEFVSILVKVNGMVGTSTTTTTFNST